MSELKKRNKYKEPTIEKTDSGNAGDPDVDKKNAGPKPWVSLLDAVDILF